MAMKVKETGTDHHGNELPDGVSATTREGDGAIVGYRIRWWEKDRNGIRRPTEPLVLGAQAGLAGPSVGGSDRLPPREHARR